MKIKEQTRKLSTTSKQYFEVVDDSKCQIELTWFEEILE
ncbi:chlorohydrolase [Streptococcus pneumoniae]|nr:chlorohydrolase [Streptococcus pneumoniae]